MLFGIICERVCPSGSWIVKIWDLEKNVPLTPLTAYTAVTGTACPDVIAKTLYPAQKSQDVLFSMAVEGEQWSFAVDELRM